MTSTTERPRLKPCPLCGTHTRGVLCSSCTKNAKERGHTPEYELAARAAAGLGFGPLAQINGNGVCERCHHLGITHPSDGTCPFPSWDEQMSEEGRRSDLEDAERAIVDAALLLVNPEYDYLELPITELDPARGSDSCNYLCNVCGKLAPAESRFVADHESDCVLKPLLDAVTLYRERLKAL